MSIPSGKPGNSLDLWDYESRKARERTAAERYPTEDETNPLRSPYAPKRANEPASAELHHPVDRDAAALFQPAHPSRGRHPLPAAERYDEIVSDHDLKRLEASLRLLQRQDASARLPRATLPPAPALAPVEARSARHSGGTSGDSFRSPRSMQAERLVPPPAMSRRNIRALFGILIVSTLVATIAYYFATGGWAPPSEPAPEPQTAPTVVAPPSWSTGQQAPRPTMAQDDDRATSAQTEIPSQRKQTSQPARSSKGKTGAMLQPGEPGAQAPSPGKATRALDPEEIKLLTKQGEQFASAGDLAAARILFQRAAEAGDVTAATALGATYDPNVLAKLGVVGRGADVEKARSWYRKAESFGSPEASRRLKALANR
jgi:hypothetical protein